MRGGIAVGFWLVIVAVVAISVFTAGRGSATAVRAGVAYIALSGVLLVIGYRKDRL